MSTFIPSALEAADPTSNIKLCLGANIFGSISYHIVSVAMSSGGIAAAPPKESQTFKRAVRKIKCGGLVASLAKGWQGWANQHSEKQDTIPSGWMPSSVEEGASTEQKNVVKLTVTPRVITADHGEKPATPIRARSIAKTVQPKRSECSSLHLVNAIRGKMESGAEESKRYLGGESPTRRRHMRALREGGGGGGVIQERKLMLQEKKLESRSSSVDTEDSGLGEETGLSDTGDAKAEQEELQPKKQTSRPKVKRCFSLSREGSGGPEGRRGGTARSHRSPTSWSNSKNSGRPIRALQRLIVT